MIQRKYSGIQ